MAERTVAMDDLRPVVFGAGFWTPYQITARQEVGGVLGAEISLAAVLNGPPVLSSRAEAVSCSTGSPRVRPGPFAIAVPEAN